MKKHYKGKAIAGTACVSEGWVVVKEIVNNHYPARTTTANPEFSELVGVKVCALSPNPPPLKISFMRNP